MRDDEARRFARHIALAEIGRAGQQALLAASARVEGVGAATETAAAYLTAGGVRVDATSGDRVDVPDRPAWWPACEGDDRALAFWRGGTAAAQWMLRVARTRS